MQPAYQEQHIVLRVNDFSTEGAAAAPAGTRGVITRAEGLSVEIDEIKPAEIPELTSSRGVLAVAPVLPMRLITPVAQAAPLAAPQAGQAAWGISAVGADTSPYSGAGIVVAVLDTGIKLSHPAFQGMNIERRNFTDEGDDDLHGHGTHCAGTIFGQDVNGYRIGVARGISKALIGKVLSATGGTSAQIAEAMQWAVQNGAHVISMSLGMDFTSAREAYKQQGLPDVAATSRALEGFRANVRLFESLAGYLRAGSAFMQPSLLIAAAGNESDRPHYEIAVSPPAVSEGFISVAALGQSAAGYVVAPFSNTGAEVAAPGVDIISAAPGGGYVQMSGTSMATPHVAGVAALWCEKALDTASFKPSLLTGALIGSANYNGLVAGLDTLQVGKGLVHAPQ